MNIKIVYAQSALIGKFCNLFGMLIYVAFVSYFFFQLVGRFFLSLIKFVSLYDLTCFMLYYVVLVII